MKIPKEKNQDDMWFINDGAYATVTSEKDNNHALDVEGDADDLDHEPAAWNNFDDINTSCVSYVHTTKEVAPNEKEADIFLVPHTKQARLRVLYEKMYPRPDLADNWNTYHKDDKE